MSKPSFNSMREKYINDDSSDDNNVSQLDNISVNLEKSSKETNILEQMVSYESVETDDFIHNLKNSLDDQKKINNILKTSNYEDNKEDIEKFINDNKDNIYNQLSSLENIFIEIKKIVNENENMKKNQPKYDELAENIETKELINNMVKLKTLKKSINFFLNQNGVDVFI